MSTRAVRSVLLVARREIRERLRSKGFRVAFALVLLGVVALTVVPKFINPATSSDVGVVGSPPPGFEQTLTATAAEGNDVTVTTYADTAAGEDALRSGDIDVLWDPGAGQLVVENTVDPALASQGRAAATQVRFSANATALGLTPEEQQQLLTPPTMQERALEPTTEDDAARNALAFGGTIALFIAISIFGGYVLTGVVTEKTSRIAEVLLSQVKASHLLAGKVLGIGSLALAELLALGVAVLVAGSLADTIPIPTVGLGAVATTIGFFVLGFAIYATLYGAAGALVNRQEDAQAVTYPVMLPLLAGYLVAISTLGDPDNPLGVALSLFPLTAPVEMPLRIQLGDVPLWQVIASVAISLAFIWITIIVAGRVYAGGLLRTGSRVKVRDALRAADDLTTP
jgi:ABC-2 type transport system permease protein